MYTHLTIIVKTDTTLECHVLCTICMQKHDTISHTHTPTLSHHSTLFQLNVCTRFYDFLSYWFMKLFVLLSYIYTYIYLVKWKYRINYATNNVVGNFVVLTTNTNTLNLVYMYMIDVEFHTQKTQKIYWNAKF